MFNKKLIAVVGFGLLSSVAFADNSWGPTPSPTPGHESCLKYYCRYDRHHNGGDNAVSPDWGNHVRCEVEGAVRYHGQDPFMLRCTDGTTLQVSDASTKLDHNDVWVSAAAGGISATVLIRDVHHLSPSNVEVPAPAPGNSSTLVLSENGTTRVLDGECRIRLYDHGHDGNDGHDGPANGNELN